MQRERVENNKDLKPTEKWFGQEGEAEDKGGGFVGRTMNPVLSADREGGEVGRRGTGSENAAFCLNLAQIPSKPQQKELESHCGKSRGGGSS